MTHTSVWVKIPKLCHNTPLSIFSLGKGGNPYLSKPYIKKLSTSVLSALPSTRKRFRQNVDDAHQNYPKYVYFFWRISHLSSNRREQNLAFYFQFTTPARKLTHKTKFEQFWMQKDTNFGNAIILHHLGPEKCQKSYPERHKFRQRHNSSPPWARELPNPTKKVTNFGKLHSLTPAKMPAK